MDEPKITEGRNGTWTVRSNALMSQFRTMSEAAREIAQLHKLANSLDKDNQEMHQQSHSPSVTADPERWQCRGWSHT